MKNNRKRQFGIHKSSKHTSKTWQKRQNLVTKSSKIPQKHGKNDNLMSKIDQQRAPMFQKSLSKQELRNFHLNRDPVRFFLGKSDSKKGGGS